MAFPPNTLSGGVTSVFCGRPTQTFGSVCKSMLLGKLYSSKHHNEFSPKSGFSVAAAAVDSRARSTGSAVEATAGCVGHCPADAAACPCGVAWSARSKSKVLAANQVGKTDWSQSSSCPKLLQSHRPRPLRRVGPEQDAQRPIQVGLEVQLKSVNCCNPLSGDFLRLTRRLAKNQTCSERWCMAKRILSLFTCPLLRCECGPSRRSPLHHWRSYVRLFCSPCVSSEGWALVANG
jgi:hypothetical protein